MIFGKPGFALAFTLTLILVAPVFAADLPAVVEQHIRHQFEGSRERLVVTVKASAAQIAKAKNCGDLRTFAPPGQRAGQRLGARGYIGVHCVDPVAAKSWKQWVPVRLQRFGEVAVSARALSRGSTIMPADLALVERDIAALPADTLIDPQQLIDKELTQAVAAGKPLRMRQVRKPRLVRRGDTVQVTIRGRGYQASSSAQAIGEGGIGDRLTVRIPSGKTLSGRVTGSGKIEVGR